MGQCALEMGRASFHTKRMKANLRSRVTVSRSISLAAFPSSLAAILLAGCVPPPATPGPAPTIQRPTEPASPTAPRPAPAVGTDWRDMPITPGNWTYSANTEGSIANFGAGMVALQCNLQTRTVTLRRAAAPRSQTTMMSIATSDAAHSLTARASSNGIEAALPARDPLLDAMAFSRGRFAVATPGEPTLYVPSWSEVTRVIEDCR